MDKQTGGRTDRQIDRLSVTVTNTVCSVNIQSVEDSQRSPTLTLFAHQVLAQYAETLVSFPPH